VAAATIALLCLMAPAAAAGLAPLLRGEDGPAPGITAGGGADPGARQAGRVQQILTPAKADQVALVQAVPKISGCGDVPAALSDLRRAGAGRRRELDAARALRISALPSGRQLASTLAEAMLYSLATGEALIRWGEIVEAQRCSRASLADQQRRVAAESSVLATAAKERFVRLWAPIAQRYAYPVITIGDL
jgi:hypothetical protein